MGDDTLMVSRATPVYWLRPAGERSAAGARSLPFAAPRCHAPRLRGEQRLLDRVLHALRGVGDLAHGHNIVDGRHIVALEVDDDSAELALSFRAGCGLPQHIAEAAFQALRRELPARDLFVTHPR